jgi:hypoxanthine phosphoribosyltransferase
LKPQPKLNLLYSRQQIAETVGRLAAELNRDYPGKHPVLIGVLKGSFMFLADLIRLLDFSLEVDFVRLSSYGAGQKSSGKIRVVADLQKPVKDRDVLVVEDIVDTGLTTGFLLTHLRRQKPSSLKLCALTEKPSRRKVPVTIDYLGLTVPDKFIVGYGLDWDERFRNLPGIYVLEE